MSAEGLRGTLSKGASHLLEKTSGLLRGFALSGQARCSHCVVSPGMRKKGKGRTQPGASQKSAWIREDSLF